MVPLLVWKVTPEGRLLLMAQEVMLPNVLLLYCACKSTASPSVRVVFCGE